MVLEPTDGLNNPAVYCVDKAVCLSTPPFEPLYVMENRIVDSVRVPTALWQTALDQSTSGIIVYEAVRDDDGRIKTFVIRLANRRSEQIVGLTRGAMLGRTADALFPQSQSAPFWADVARVIETSRAHHAEFFHRVSRTQRESWFDLDIEPLGDGQSAIVSFADITELKNAAQSMLREAILFKTLSSSVPGMCVLVINHQQQVLFASGELPDLFASRSTDQVVGQRVVATIRTEYHTDWQHYVGSALLGEPHSFGGQWGSWRGECYVGPVRNERGDVVMALCVYRDTSEQFRQQQTLQRINHDLQRSNQDLEQFAYVASHDLQEPLRKIKSFGDLLSERYAPKLDEAGTDLVRRMQSAADRMNDLIRNLLSYARLTAPGGLTEHQKREFIRLSDVLDDSLTDLEMMIHERGAAVRTSPDLPTITGDATQLRQLLQNLLTNAIKFTRPDQRPEVVITGRLVSGREIPDYPGVDPLLPYAQISVQDNGIGIAPENFEKIFALFGRLNSRRQFVGTGIGLATCRRIVENHGGTITVESQLDHGTTFHVYLPMQV